ncbi:MAG: HU family DNA-binding protein [Bacteroidaceae bacterium]|nr:HU family DNA-binding protein [Bacteroidaceae bacterium]MBR5531410.1 HU family DNA-binding protein [Bacteroidaceae bacterium]
MTVKFNMRKMPSLNGDETVLYPQMFGRGVFDTDELAQQLSERCSLTPGDVKAALSGLADMMAERMAAGYSVRLDGIGVFSASLGLVDGKEREQMEGARRNAASIKVRGVNFRADRQLVQRTDANCRPERTTRRFATSSTRYTPQERLQLALDYIAAHGRMRLDDYVRLTGLTRSTASRELCRLAADATSGLQSNGRGPVKCYVAAAPTEQ